MAAAVPSSSFGISGLTTLGCTSSGRTRAATARIHDPAVARESQPRRRRARHGRGQWLPRDSRPHPPRLTQPQTTPTLRHGSVGPSPACPGTISRRNKANRATTKPKPMSDRPVQPRSRCRGRSRLVRPAHSSRLTRIGGAVHTAPESRCPGDRSRRAAPRERRRSGWCWSGRRLQCSIDQRYAPRLAPPAFPPASALPGPALHLPQLVQRDHQVLPEVGPRCAPLRLKTGVSNEDDIWARRPGAGSGTQLASGPSSKSAA